MHVSRRAKAAARQGRSDPAATLSGRVARGEQARVPPSRLRRAQSDLDHRRPGGTLRECKEDVRRRGRITVFVLSLFAWWCRAFRIPESQGTHRLLPIDGIVRQAVEARARPAPLRARANESIWDRAPVLQPGMRSGSTGGMRATSISVAFQSSCCARRLQRRRTLVGYRPYTALRVGLGHTESKVCPDEDRICENVERWGRVTAREITEGFGMETDAPRAALERLRHDGILSPAGRPGGLYEPPKSAGRPTAGSRGGA